MKTMLRLAPAVGLLWPLFLLAPISLEAEVTLPQLVGNVEAGSQLIPCSRAAEHLVINRSSHLDPACKYTGGVEVISSNVVFDCRGALIDDPERNDSRGIVVHAPTRVPLSGIKVRNCTVRGFLNNFVVTRDGFRTLPAGGEYAKGFSRIELRNSRLLASRDSGILVDAYVSDVRLRDLEVADSGGVGIYLQAGSRDNRIVRSHIHDNGFGDVEAVNGAAFKVGAITLRYLSTGREGLAIDGSRDNYVARNRFENNSNGAILLYKNCGEYATQSPGQWWPRRYGANGNRIRRNTIVGEPHGVWVGSRMSENQLLLDCSGTPYFVRFLQQIHEDFAKNNLIQGNMFIDVPIAIRIEDDGTRVERNRIASDNRDHVAVVVGTGYRSSVLGRPVINTLIRGNRVDIFLGQAPYLWVEQLGSLIFERNRNNGFEALIHRAIPPQFNAHLFVRQFLTVP